MFRRALLPLPFPVTRAPETSSLYCPVTSWAVSYAAQ